MNRLANIKYILSRGLVPAFVAASLTPAAAQEQKLFDVISVSDGMPHSEVTSVVADHSGFIWLGTLNGLTRHDGHNLKTYTGNDSLNSLSNSRVLSLCVGDDSLLYIGTEGGGLNIMDLSTNSFSHYINFSNLIYSVDKGLDGNIWAGTGQGVYLLRNMHDNTSLRSFASSVTRVSDVCEIAPGVILAASDAGLFRVDTGTDVSERIMEGYFRAVCQTGDGVWLAGGVAGLYRCDSSGDVEHISGLDVSVIYMTADSDIWVGTMSGGLYRYNAELERTAEYQYGNPDTGKGLSNNGIHSLYEDFSGVLWIGTQNGVNKLTDEAAKFELYSRILDETGSGNYTSKNQTSTFFEDSDNNLWVASYQSNLKILDRKNGKLTVIGREQAPELADATISAFHRDPNGALWIGTWNNLYVLQPGYMKDIHARRRLKLTGMGERFNMTSFTVFKIVEDPDGELWLSTDNGIYRYIPARDDYYNGRMVNYSNRRLEQSLLTDNIITDIFVDQKAADGAKTIWAGSHRGLNRMTVDGEEITNVKIYRDNDEGGLKGDFISVIHEDADGELWVVGIEGYINRVAGNRHNGEQPVFQSFDINSGGTFDTTESLLEDGDGNFWIGGVRLIRFDPGTGERRYYDEEDGLQNNSFKIWSSLKLSSGELVFGGINGFSVFDPEALSENKLPPRVVLDELSVFDRTIEPNRPYNGRVILERSLNETGRITLPYRMNSIEISFASLHYVSPSKNRYRYKLEGYDQSWRHSQGAQNNATYTNLSPGRYVFTVYGSNCDNVWAELPKTLEVEILPPLWQTNAAYAFYLLLSLWALYLFRRGLIRKEKRKNAIAMEQMMRREESRIHQMKLKYFTDISHELKTPLTLIAAPVEELSANPGLDGQTAKKLTLVRRNIARLMDLIEQIMDFRKYENKLMNLNLSEENIAALCKKVMLYFEDQAERKGITFTFDSPESDMNVTIDRERIEKVLFNIIGNAFKYTGEGGTIKVACRRTEQGVTVEVGDDGPGIEQSEIGRVFEQFYQGEKSVEGGTGIGLALAKAIVEQHKGTIGVESETGKGAVFRFTLLSGISHFSESERATLSKQRTPVANYSTDLDTLLRLQDTLSAENGESAGKSSILVVEDSRELREYLKEALAPHFSVLAAENGKIALEMALDNDIELIVSDIMMPVMDGIELCRAVKGDIRLSHIPVVLLTAKGEVEHRIEGFESGADEYIPKPFEMKLLVARVNNLIRQRDRLREVFRKQITIEPSMVTVTPVDERFLQKCIGLVEANIQDSAFNVDDLCKGVGLSRPAVYKKIKSLTGLSVVEFIRSIRLKRAAQLLSQDASSIKNIMYMVGFDSSSYFSSRFRKEFGCTPNEYAAKQRQ
jgi:signal transduction histidine kinase/CheY-like chemotaxis protein/ligand-binding sensor domain-containing protein/AraC-like DNA-binding protein